MKKNINNEIMRAFGIKPKCLNNQINDELEFQQWMLKSTLLANYNWGSLQSLDSQIRGQTIDALYYQLYNQLYNNVKYQIRKDLNIEETK